jgi:endonuclease/exonuclease/phosphatase (EEP) superfamily protein YafD
LQALIQSAARSTSAPAIILAGDFNVDARALSLAPIRETMKDAWTKAGRGWGDTILASFPVARIDHVWYQGSLQASHARTEITSESDHRAVVVELSWNPNANASP